MVGSSILVSSVACSTSPVSQVEHSISTGSATGVTVMGRVWASVWPPPLPENPWSSTRKATSSLPYQSGPPWYVSPARAALRAGSEPSATSSLPPAPCPPASTATPRACAAAAAGPRRSAPWEQFSVTRSRCPNASSASGSETDTPSISSTESSATNCRATLTMRWHWRRGAVGSVLPSDETRPNSESHSVSTYSAPGSPQRGGSFRPGST
mmetsp:Transcript_35515/g.61451  ORF Transcript_35515/g.61451 Transcript_35515/m.61451 type:complete len:211 (-) Transcript_35515:3088-3720(-)